MKNTIKLLLVTASVALLAACGGGGGGGDAQITPPTLDLRTAWATYFQSNRSNNFTVSGSVNNINVTGNGTMIVGYATPASILAIDPSSPFPGPSVNISNLSKTTLSSNGTIAANGNQSLISSTVEYYVDANGAFKVIKDVDDDEQTIVTAFTNFPAQTTSGSAGILYTGTVYSRLGYTCGTETASYSVAAESNTALIVTVTFSKNTTNRTIGQCETVTSTSQNKYRLTAAGGLSPVNSVGSSSVASGVLTLTF
jgi:hypothetical protein